ncbi:MAG: anion permease [Acidobacteria bacterium]|nr:anion permease [Acidobacteriota bacterium]
MVGQSVQTAPPPVVEATPAASSKLKLAGRALAVLIPLGFWFVPLGLEATVQHALAITTFMILGWITEAFDHAITGFLGCFLYWFLEVVRFPVAFSGFANDTTWFLFGAMLIGMMAMKTGLARRIAFMIMLTVGNSYARILLGLIIVNYVLTYFVPSAISRLVIVAAIGMGLMEILGVGKGSNIGRGMFMILTYVANIFDKMILAGASALTAKGLMEQIAQIQVSWGGWAYAFLPCGIITIFVAWRLALWLYPPEVEQLPGGASYFRQELAKMGRWSIDEKKAALLLVAALGLWLTDTKHEMPAAMVGLGIGLLAVLPGIGVLNVEDLKKVNYLPVFFVAAAISMGQVLVATKSLDVLTNAMFNWMSPLITGTFSAAIVLYWTAFAYHLFLASEISMLGTSTPMIMQFALSHNMSPLILGMLWVFGAGAKIFIYQSGVMVVGYSYGYFGTKDMFKVGLWLTIIEFFILLGLVAVYWPMIGLR